MASMRGYTLANQVLSADGLVAHGKPPAHSWAVVSMAWGPEPYIRGVPAGLGLGAARSCSSRVSGVRRRCAAHTHRWRRVEGARSTTAKRSSMMADEADTHRSGVWRRR